MIDRSTDAATWACRDWEVELLHATIGGRDADLRHLGSLDEYVEVHIANSSNTVAARITFTDAVERLIDGWQPDPLAKPVQTFRMLELIFAYAPRGGFEKALSILNRWPERRMVMRIPFTAGGEADLYLEALRALEKYFPATPHRETAAYQVYVATLKAQISRTAYATYAAERLMALGELGLQDDTFADWVMSHPETIRVLVHTFVADQRDTLVTEHLTELYHRCHAAAKLIEFRAAVRACGGSVTSANAREGRAIEIRFGQRRIALTQSPSQMRDMLTAMVDNNVFQKQMERVTPASHEPTDGEITLPTYRE
jgi:hypothetical protein